MSQLVASRTPAVPLATGPTAREHRDTAVRRTWLAGLLLAALGVAVLRQGLHLDQLWPVLALSASQVWLAVTAWRAAVRERDHERLLGHPTWPSAVDLARL